MSDPNNYRLPPQSIESEESILAAIMLYSDNLQESIEILKPSDFYRDAHKIIFETCCDLTEHKTPVDLITVQDKLRETALIDKVGGVTYLAKLVDSCPIAPSIKHYAEILRKKALQRRLITAVNKIMNNCYQFKGNSEALLDEAQKTILEVEYDDTNDHSSSMKDMVAESNDRYEHLAKSPGTMTGIPTGYADLDTVICGFQNSDLIIIAGRPSMGKTSLVLNIAGNMGSSGCKVGIFSLEMSKTHVFDRMISSLAGVHGMKFKSGRFSKDDWIAIIEASSKIYNWDIFIDDTAGLSFLEIRRRARRMKKQHEIEIILIDYLGLMKGDRTRGRVYEIESITQEMKAMAKDLNVPVILLSQLNRKCEERPNKRPVLSDLRDSGAIEQDADIVILLYCDEKYNKDTKDAGIMELNIAKHRNGPTRMIKLKWHERTTKFSSLERNY